MFWPMLFLARRITISNKQVSQIVIASERYSIPGLSASTALAENSTGIIAVRTAVELHHPSVDLWAGAMMSAVILAFNVKSL